MTLAEIVQRFENLSDAVTVCNHRHEEMNVARSAFVAYLDVAHRWMEQMAAEPFWTEYEPDGMEYGEVMRARTALELALENAP